MTIKAVAFRVLVRPKNVDAVSKGGIDLSAVDQKMERNAQITGTIIDIGPDVYKAFKTTEEFAGLKIGDIVYYPKYAGKWVPDFNTGEELLMLNDEDVCGKWIPDDNINSVVAS